MNQDQRNKKAEQLRIAAHIIETWCEWEAFSVVRTKWFNPPDISDPVEAIEVGYEIRIKPSDQIKEPIIPIPEGWRELPDSEKNGRWIEGAKWLSPIKMWEHYASIGGQSNNGAYADGWNRIIVPVAKPKKRVPLEPSDVVPGSVVRKIKNRSSEWNMIAAISVNGVKTSVDNYGSWETLMEQYEIKRPTDTEWQGCWKLEE